MCKLQKSEAHVVLSTLAKDTQHKPTGLAWHLLMLNTPGSRPTQPDDTSIAPGDLPIQGKGDALLTSALEEVAVDILDGGVDGRSCGDTARSDIRIILRINILKSFPWNSRMEFCSWKPKHSCMLEYLHTAL